MDRCLTFLSLLVLYALPSKTVGQRPPYYSAIEKMAGIDPIADMDTSMNVNHFSYNDYKQAIHRLYSIDQKYRGALEDDQLSPNDASQSEKLRLMKINDRANEVVFLKLLKKFGWPKNANDDILFKSWILVWHSEKHYKNQFEAYVYDALQKGDITRDYYEGFKFD